VLGVLRDPGEVTAPLLPAPGIADLPALVDRARCSGLDVDLRFEGEQPSELSDASSLTAYRIVQESLTNARRHAPGAPVSVGVTFDSGRMSILVENLSAEPIGNGATSGVGLQGMAERVNAVGGALQAGPTEDGFAVHARLPYGPTR
jgi:signal transduction histidine kinase